ncbi:hypothetical protein DCS_06723 [Drechmeria coniospora]|uniref:Uncharacterized protein n=1 Tax=Drechmeria coniospora TaxID=98403 RepID=A0A151GCH8_DRECN|nr:hypothetical protein DCS_06723 [Drechmeria coniospora]KYK54763.1 hypothetical protein DCS_06723 [Drechmeria coniospora]
MGGKEGGHQAKRTCELECTPRPTGAADFVAIIASPGRSHQVQERRQDGTETSSRERDGPDADDADADGPDADGPDAGIDGSHLYVQGGNIATKWATGGLQTLFVQA